MDTEFSVFLLFASVPQWLGRPAYTLIAVTFTRV